MPHFTKHTLYLFILILLTGHQLSAQVLIEQKKNYGGPDNDGTFSLETTPDGGYIAVGTTTVFDTTDTSENHLDYWILKLDSNFDLEWEKKYGGSEDEEATAVINTPDGGYIVVGCSRSIDGDVGGNYSIEVFDSRFRDYWIIKLDSSGNLIWEQNYGGNKSDKPWTITKAENDTYFIAGQSSSNDGIVDSYGNLDYWIIKIDGNGKLLWEQNYGGSKNEVALSILKTTDGNFLVTGGSNSSDGDVQSHIGGNDIWCIKIDESGTLLEENSYGYENSDETSKSVEVLEDGSYIFVGTTDANDTSNDDFEEEVLDNLEQLGELLNYYDVLVIKTDSNSNEEWSNIYNRRWHDYGASIVSCQDGGFLVLGKSTTLNYFRVHEDGIITPVYGRFSFWLIKLDENGEIIWRRLLKGRNNEDPHSLLNIGNNEFVIMGNSNSSEGHFNNSNGYLDAWFFKIKDIGQSPRIVANSFLDENQNGLFDNGELPISNEVLSLEPNAIDAYTNEFGQGIFYVENGDYVLSYDDTDTLWQLTSTTAEYNVNITEGDTTKHYNYGFYPNNPVSSAEIHLIETVGRCNNNALLRTVITNTGNLSADGIIAFTLDSLLTVTSTIPPYSYEENGIYYWEFENLPPSQRKYLTLEVELPSEQFTGIEITNSGLVDVLDNDGNVLFTDTDQFSGELRCSYDPNDKLVYPVGQGTQGYTLFEEDNLDYTVRFQNTGNDTAFSIMVKDTISPYLDLSTFELLAHSHPIQTLIDKNTREITFYFNDIYLPDSGANLVGSQGFLKYNIGFHKPLLEFTKIENRAGIYFDLNPPIITNTVINTMVSELPNEGGNGLESVINLFVQPNPSFGRTFLSFDNRNNEKHTLTLTDATGRPVLIIKDQTGNHFEIDGSRLTKGLYLYKLQDENGKKIGTGRLVIL